MEIFDKKISILKASKKRAEEFSSELLKAKTPKGKAIFTRNELPNGFEINGKRLINEKLHDCTILRYTNNEGRQMIEYDSYAITIE